MSIRRTLKHAHNPVRMMDLRSHGVELARKSLLDSSTKADQTWRRTTQRISRNVGIHTKLRRLAPGGTSSLCAMRLPTPPGEPDTASSGEITTKPDRIAAGLARHWGNVFGDAPIDRAALGTWLRQALHPPDVRPPPEAAQWRIRKRDVARAIRCSGNSMPGPDRIPHVAWKK